MFGHSKDVGIGTVAVGFTNFQYDGGLEDDTEVYLGLSTELAGFGSSVKVIYGVNGALTDMVLIEGNLSYGFEISEKASGEVSLTAGYLADEGDGGAFVDDGFAYGNFSVGVDYAVSDEITFSPYVAYTSGDSDALGAGNAFNGLYGGASLSYSF